MNRQIELFDGELSHAIFSPCEQYRYALKRHWNPNKEPVAFIGLNPSTADASHDDPTIRKCRNFALRWGYGGLIMLNLFAFRATDPRVMKAATEPIGPENDWHLRTCARQAKKVFAAWGNDGAHLERDRKVLALFPKLWCLHVNEKTGMPQHPLYVPGDVQPLVYRGRP